MPQLIIEPNTPYDLSAAEEQEMRAALREAASAEDVQIVRRREEGYGVGLEEVLHVFVENRELATAAFGAISALVGWLRQRSRIDARRRTVLIYGPDGEPIKTVEIDAEGESTEGPPTAERRRVPTQPES